MCRGSAQHLGESPRLKGCYLDTCARARRDRCCLAGPRYTPDKAAEARFRDGERRACISGSRAAVSRRASTTTRSPRSNWMALLGGLRPGATERIPPMMEWARCSARGSCCSCSSETRERRALRIRGERARHRLKQLDRGSPVGTACIFAKHLIYRRFIL